MSTSPARCRNDELYEQLPASRDAMIEHNQRLVHRKVWARCRRSPYLQSRFDELEGAGLVALVEAVDALCSYETVAPTQYLTRCITCAIDDAIKDLSVVCIPSRTKHRMLKHGSCPVSDEPLCETMLAADDTSAEVYEVIEQCCETDQQCRAVALLREGYGPAEVAELLGVSFVTVYRWRTQIEAQYDQADLR